MNLEKAISFFRGEEDAIKISFWQILGPISLLCTVALAARSWIPVDLLVLALIGLYLCARWQMRGCVYALISLGIAALVRHAFVSSQHLWELGLEASLGCAFLITALAFEKGSLFIQSLTDQIETRGAALQNTEEDLAKEREAALSTQLSLQEKIDSLQKELEEMQSEHSSLFILNEVLRKTSARHLEENRKVVEELLDAQRFLGALKIRSEALEKEVARLSSEEGLVRQNGDLLKELNAARSQKEQTHLINEMLARLHAKESLKAKEAYEQLQASQQEIAQKEEQLALARGEMKMLSVHLEQTALDLQNARAAQETVVEIQTQNNFLRERLEAAEREMALLQKRKDPELENQVALLQKEKEELEEKIHALSQIEPLFKQLKKQFEEKNQILHETRSELFKMDTELQNLRIEKGEAALRFNPIPNEVCEEMEELDGESRQLVEENRELEEIITLLLQKTPSKAAPQRKKKVTMTPEQGSLF